MCCSSSLNYSKKLDISKAVFLAQTFLCVFVETKFIIVLGFRNSSCLSQQTQAQYAYSRELERPQLSKVRFTCVGSTGLIGIKSGHPLAHEVITDWNVCKETLKLMKSLSADLWVYLSNLQLFESFSQPWLLYFIGYCISALLPTFFVCLFVLFPSLASVSVHFFLHTPHVPCPSSPHLYPPAGISLRDYGGRWWLKGMCVSVCQRR